MKFHQAIRVRSACINFIQYSFKEYLWKPLFHTCYVSLYFLVTKCTQIFPWFFHSSWTHHLHPPSKLYTVESIIYLDLNPHNHNPRLFLSHKTTLTTHKTTHCFYYYDKLGASYLFPDGIAVDATGSCVDKNARDVNLSKHSIPNSR